MDSFRPQCDFFIFFHNDTVSFLCYEKSVSEKYSCGQIRMITYLQINHIISRQKHACKSGQRRSGNVKTDFLEYL